MWSSPTRKKEQPATNLTETPADAVSLWDAGSKSWANVRDVFVNATFIASPSVVAIPVADEVETRLVYENPTSNHVPALDGILAFIKQEKLAGPGVTNRYVSVKRKNYFISEGDEHITKKAVTVQVVKRFAFLDVYAPTIISKKAIKQKVVRPTYILEGI